MNDVSFHVPYIFGNKQNSKSEEEQKAQQKTEKLGTKRGQQWALTDQRERQN